MNTRAIKRWALTHDITWVMVAQEAGVSRQQVSNVIHNRRADDSVSRALCWLGCPTRLMSTRVAK